MKTKSSFHRLNKKLSRHEMYIAWATIIILVAGIAFLSFNRDVLLGEVKANNEEAPAQLLRTSASTQTQSTVTNRVRSPIGTVGIPICAKGNRWVKVLQPNDPLVVPFNSALRIGWRGCNLPVGVSTSLYLKVYDRVTGQLVMGPFAFYSTSNSTGEEFYYTGFQGIGDPTKKYKVEIKSQVGIDSFGAPIFVSDESDNFFTVQ